MREPATSCQGCGKVLLWGEILYTERAAIVCESCLAATGPAGARPRLGVVATTTTPFERRQSLSRWSIVFLVLMTMALSAVQAAKARVRFAYPIAIIDSPDAGAIVSSRLVVRGRVALDAITAPLWLVARSGEEASLCRELVREPVVADRAGRFTVTASLPGPRGQRYWLSVVAVGPGANRAFEEEPTAPLSAWLALHSGEQGGVGRRCRARGARLPRDTTVLTSVGVTLGEGEPWFIPIAPALGHRFRCGLSPIRNEAVVE